MIEEESCFVIVKPNASRNELLGYDKEKAAYRVAVKAAAVDNKANNELVKFLSKLLKKRVMIVSGAKSKKKMIEVV